MKAAILTFLSCFILSLSACEKIPVPPEQKEPQKEQKQPEDNGQQNGNENTQTMTMEITAGGKTIIATLADNATAKALAEKLKSGSVTVEMRANGFEHYGPLGFSLERHDEQISAVSGDIMLYNGNNICVFYGNNSWSYTPLGKVDGKTADELKAFFGTSTVTVTYSLKQ
ncbi:MAG: hypothetical protein J6S99_05905 [Bacteroidales bacterium]|nr:hypothetical protein [Bacteroidales bacterium]